MRLSEERITVLARQLADALLDDELVDLEIAEDRFIFLIENLILEDLRMEERIDEEAAARLRVQKPHLQDGTSEWDIALDKVREDLAITKGYVIR